MLAPGSILQDHQGYYQNLHIQIQTRPWPSGHVVCHSSDHRDLSSQQTFDRLTDISNELQALGATDITDHEVEKKLLRSLDSSFDTLALMIQERADYKSLDPADILERLSTHEF